MKSRRGLGIFGGMLCLVWSKILFRTKFMIPRMHLSAIRINVYAFDANSSSRVNVANSSRG